MTKTAKKSMKHKPVLQRFDLPDGSGGWIMMESQKEFDQYVADAKRAQAEGRCANGCGKKPRLFSAWCSHDCEAACGGAL